MNDELTHSSFLFYYISLSRHEYPIGITYEIGDPLPILYDIDINNTGWFNSVKGDTVISMPFPIVLNDLLSLKDVICESSSFILAKPALSHNE